MTERVSVTVGQIQPEFQIPASPWVQPIWPPRELVESTSIPEKQLFEEEN